MYFSCIWEKAHPKGNSVIPWRVPGGLRCPVPVPGRGKPFATAASGLRRAANAAVGGDPVPQFFLSLASVVI